MVLYSYRYTDGGEIWHGGVDLSAKFHPHRSSVLPLWGEKRENQRMCNLNTGALRYRNAAGNEVTFTKLKVDPIVLRPQPPLAS